MTLAFRYCLMQPRSTISSKVKSKCKIRLHDAAYFSCRVKPYAPAGENSFNVVTGFRASGRREK